MDTHDILAPAAPHRRRRPGCTSDGVPADQLSSDWVLAAPFGTHVRHVMASSGQPWRVIALAAAVPAPTVRSLVMGRSRRIPAGIARRLMDVSPESIAALSQRVVPAAGVGQHVARLRGAGFSWTDIADFAGLSIFEVRQLSAAGATCPALAALRIAAATEAHRLYFHESSHAAA